MLAQALAFTFCALVIYPFGACVDVAVGVGVDDGVKDGVEEGVKATAVAVDANNAICVLPEITVWVFWSGRKVTFGVSVKVEVADGTGLVGEMALVFPSSSCACCVASSERSSHAVPTIPQKQHRSTMPRMRRSFLKKLLCQFITTCPYILNSNYYCTTNSKPGL